MSVAAKMFNASQAAGAEAGEAAAAAVTAETTTIELASRYRERQIVTEIV